MSSRGTKQSHGSTVALYSKRLPHRASAHSRFAPRYQMGFIRRLSLCAFMIKKAFLSGSLSTYFNTGCCRSRDF